MAARARRPLMTLALLLALAGGVLFGARALRHWLRPPEPMLPLGVLRVGIDPTMPPFAWMDSAGRVHGIEAELARALSTALGVPVQFIPLGYDGLYDALETDQADVLISGLMPVSARMSHVRYSISYYNAGLVLVSPQENPLPDMPSLSGLHLAYAYGTDADSEAQRWLRRIAPFEPRPYESPSIALDAVRLGDADAALVDSTSARLYGRTHPGWEVHSADITVLPYAAAIRIGRPALADAIDRALAQMRDNGQIDAIIASGFASAVWTPPARPAILAA